CEYSDRLLVFASQETSCVPVSFPGRYTQGGDKARQLLAPWPILRPRNWASRVNRAEGKKELEAFRRSVQRGQPYGSELWCERIDQTLGLESIVRPRGRGVRRLPDLKKTPDPYPPSSLSTPRNSPSEQGKTGVLQPIMPLDLPVKVRPWELTVYPRSHIRR